MLKFNPNERITTEQALAHPYLKLFHVIIIIGLVACIPFPENI